MSALRRQWQSVRPWWILAVLGTGVVLEAVHSLITAQRNSLFDDWIHDAVILGAAAVCATRGRRRDRVAWNCIALGVLALGLGEVLWGLLYLNAEDIPYPNPTSAFYLASYPLFMAGLVLIVRSRLSRFELHRWLDGLVVVLIVATPMVALVLQPVLEEAPPNPFGQIVSLAYPVGDLLLLGALLGAVPLMHWRVDASWCWLGAGLTCITVSDAAFAVAAIEHEYHEGQLDWLWSAGCVAIAVASQLPARDLVPPHELTGWPAIVLPLGAQVFALATQIYAFFYEIPRTERILTGIILLIGIAQIIASRPRPQPTNDADEENRRPLHEASADGVPDLAHTEEPTWTAAPVDVRPSQHQEQR